MHLSFAYNARVERLRDLPAHGLKFFFTVAGPQRRDGKMQPVHLPRKLPVILSRDEVSRLIAAAGNLKHQTALALAYCSKAPIHFHKALLRVVL